MTIRFGIGFGILLSLAAGPARAQVQVRLGVPGRANYSELHEALRPGTPSADTVRRIQRIRSPAPLWRMAWRRSAVPGDWHSGLIALTRLAELRSKAYADSARRLRADDRDRRGESVPREPGPHAPRTSCRRSRPSSSSAGAPSRATRRSSPTSSAGSESKQYEHGDAWVLGRLGAGAADSMVARFLSADSAGVQGSLPDAALLLHRPVADSAPATGLRGARQLRAAQALRASGRRTDCSGSGRGRACRRCSMRAPRRARGGCMTTRSCGTRISISWGATARR